MKNPIVYQTSHRASFQEIDVYGHLNTIHYVNYFLSHRFEALRERFDLDLKSIRDLDVAIYTKSLDVAFLRPVYGDQLFQIKSMMTDFDDTTCKITCEMLTEPHRVHARCTMAMTCVSKETSRSTSWPTGFLSRFFYSPVSELICI